MNGIKNISFIGGDKRQIYMQSFFENLGYKTEAFAANGNERINKSIISNSDAVIFPLPVTDKSGNISSNSEIKYKITDIAGLITEKTIVFGGMLSEKNKQLFSEKRIKVYDYFAREDVAIRNAVPTVQGILKTIFNNIDYTLFSSKCAVFGFGRIGKAIADALFALGADVTVFVRKESDVALIGAKRLNACKISEKDNIISAFDIIINTVPAMMIDKSTLLKVSKNVLIIDVASAPYGVDFAEAEKEGIKAMLCPSLPGKTAPVSAGKILARGILNIMKEEGYE